MKKFLSRYSFKYPSTLVYMFQTVEYNIPDYINWFNRVKDFSKVSNRKKLEKTTTAKLLLLVVWSMIAIAWLGLAYFLFFSVVNPLLWLVLSLIVSLLAPWVLAYALIVPIFIGQQLIQRPRVAYLSRRAAKILASHPGQKIAIAGSYGKTSMKDILHTVLGEAKQVAMTPGNYNTPIGIARFAGSLRGDEDVLLLELGEYYPGDVKALAKITKPDIGIISGVTMQHMVRFKTLKAARDTVFELADYLGHKPVFVNGESKDAKERIVGSHILYNRRGCDGWRVEKTSIDLDGTNFLAKKGKKIVRAQSRLLGAHQVGPLVAAIAIADRLGCSTTQIEAGLAATEPFEHRLQPLYTIPGVTVIDDAYNGNLEGFLATIDFLYSLKAKRKIYITPGLVETGEYAADLHRQIGKQLAKQPPDVVVLMRNSVTAYIVEGLEAGKYKGKLILQEDPLSFYTNLQSFTVPGDVVVLQNDWHDNYE